MPSSHFILCRPLLLLPLIPPSITVFSNESTLCMRWPKYWSFSFSIIPSKKHLGPISFRMDWLDLLAVQGTLKSLLQYHSWKASILRHSVFFTVQLWHPYMTTGKTIALTRQTFVGKVMSLLLKSYLGCGHEFEWTPGVGDGQGALACCNSWGSKKSDTTYYYFFNWTEIYIYIYIYIWTKENNETMSLLWDNL